MDLTTLTDPDLEALRVDVLNEQDRRRIITEAPARADQLAQQYESIMGDAPATPWADLTDRVGPGQRIVWTDGETYRNISRAWLNTNDTPETYPQGWSQETGLPPDVAPFIVGEAVKVDDLRAYEGTVYRVLQAHTTQAGWTPPVVPALWTPQG
jgi:hypothetical protein